MARAAEAGTAWIEGLGVGVTNTRFARLSRLATGLHEAWSSGPDQVEIFIENRKPQVIYAALGDIYELHQIHNGLSGQGDPGLVDRLGHYVTGPDQHEQERPEKAPTSAGRDFGFELSLGAQQSSAGFAVRWLQSAAIAVRLPSG